jgi:hypothetical protein
MERHRARLMRPSFTPVGYSIRSSGTLPTSFSVDEGIERAEGSEEGSMRRDEKNTRREGS